MGSGCNQRGLKKTMTREIHPKQRAYLRSMANQLASQIHIGKEGLTDSVLAQLDQTLEAKELVKITCLETAPQTAREACEVACDALNAAPVQCIGRKFVVYRPKKKDPVIVLPRIRGARG